MRGGGAIKCINMIGSAETNGVVRNLFVKSIESPQAALDTSAVCMLQKNGFPDSFINFLGGKSFD